MSKALEDVIAERKRQIEVEGWTAEYDDMHKEGELALAGSCYALEAGDRLYLKMDVPSKLPMAMWPWSSTWWKPTTPRRDLIKAAALILAEIERIDHET